MTGSAFAIQVAAAIVPAERSRGAKEWNVFRATLALTLASAASLATAATADVSSSTLNSTAPWWEKVTVTISGDGQPQSCKFESSLRPGAAKSCEVQASSGAQEKLASSSSAKDQYTRITFERRFSPSAQADNVPPTGEMLLGQQVMALAIGSKGTVEGCRIVQKSGDMQPGYGCKEASAEKFQASARSNTAAAPHEGFMTILVYGHQEHVV